MDDKVLKDLLSKYRQGICTEEELALLENWVSVTTYSEYVISEKELQEDFDLIAKALPLVKPKETKLWPRIAVAAAAIAAITFGTWIYINEVASLRKAPRNDVAQNDIAPGKNGATITLANGKVIQLSDAKSGVVVGEALKYSDGSDVRYSSGSRSSGSLKGSQSSTGPVGVRSLTPSELQGADGKAQQLTASTAKGQTYQFTLPDGTKVWLNADSKLEFPSNFVNSITRNVKLSGEGYFEVAKDKAHPFIAETDKQTVEVLGTHFNINSYADEAGTKTTLLEGSVRVNDVILKPNQQSILTGSTRIVVNEVDATEAIFWKAGKFSFTSEEMNSVMKQVARWYNVEVQFTDDTENIKVTGSAPRFANISTLLNMLEQTGTVKFKIEGRKIVVSKGK